MSAKDTPKDKKAEKHIHDLEETVAQLTAEKDELFDKLQRMSADYANYQKRVPRQVADSVAYEKKAILRALLPSLDNFEHAFAGFSASTPDPSAQKIIDGTRLIFEHLLDALKAIGIEKVRSVGQPFDPSRHEAMMQRSEPDKENNTVLEEYQACYLLGDQVLRPARVIVNKLSEPTPAEPVTDDSDEMTDNEPEAH